MFYDLKKHIMEDGKMEKRFEPIVERIQKDLGTANVMVKSGNVIVATTGNIRHYFDENGKFFKLTKKNHKKEVAIFE